jgi:hypothetical protein
VNLSNPFAQTVGLDYYNTRRWRLVMVNPQSIQ